MLGDFTNNRLESLNQKLKAVIAKYSALPTFFRQLMACIGSVRIEHDIKAAELVMRKPVQRRNDEKFDKDYAKLLTEFAFNHYFKETRDYAQCVFMNIDANIAIGGAVASQRMITTAMVCDCSFHMSMRLPCKHILAFRFQNHLDLFEPSICADRWLQSKIDNLSQLDYVLDDNSQIEIIETPSQSKQTRRKKTFNQKFRAAKDKCDQICSLIAELPQNDFQTHYDSLCTLHNRINDAVNQGLYKRTPLVRS